MRNYYKIIISFFLLFSSFYLFSLEETNTSSCENLDIQLPAQNIAIEIYLESFLNRMNQCLSGKEKKLEIMYALYVKLIEEINNKKPDNQIDLIDTVVESFLENIPSPSSEKTTALKEAVLSFKEEENLFLFLEKNDHINIQLSKDDYVTSDSDKLFSRTTDKKIIHNYEVLLIERTTHPIHLSISFCHNIPIVNEILNPLSSLIREIADRFMTSYQFYDPTLFSSIQVLSQKNIIPDLQISQHPFSYSTEEIYSYLEYIDQLSSINEDVKNYLLKPSLKLAEINNNIIDKKLEYCTSHPQLENLLLYEKQDSYYFLQDTQDTQLSQEEQFLKKQQITTLIFEEYSSNDYFFIHVDDKLHENFVRFYTLKEKK